MSGEPARTPRRRRAARAARGSPPPPAPTRGAGGWSSRAVAMALLIGAWLGRQASILPEEAERILDLGIAIGIAALVALGYRQRARSRRSRGERSSRR